MTVSQLLKRFRSARAVADALGISKQAVHAWIRRGQIPAVRQYQIEVITAGRLRAQPTENKTAA